MAVAISHAASSGVASVAAEVPHPFFDDRIATSRGGTGISRDRDCRRTCSFLRSAAARAPGARRLFAGPSYFNVEQDLVTGVETVDEPFRYDTASFGAARTDAAEWLGVGFNAGVDLSRMFAAADRRRHDGPLRARDRGSQRSGRARLNRQRRPQVGIGMRLVF